MLNIQALLLCAGKGSRFDPGASSSKLLAPLSNGVAVLEQASHHLLAAHLRPLAIIGQMEQDRLKDLLIGLSISWVVAKQSDLGMGFSIAEGVKHSMHADGWLICLGDLPYVQTQTIQEIIATAQSHPDSIVAPMCDGQRGHPVFIPKKFREDLLALRKDEGPRHLMTNGPLFELTTSDTGIYRDVDVPSDVI